MKHGYTILEENYTKKYGEIDLIAQKGQNLHFIEVKSLVSHETKQNVPRETGTAVTHETNSPGIHESGKPVSYETYNPLENVHPMKLKRLSRVIQVYLVTHETQDWQFDVITVSINQKDRVGRIKHFQNIIL